MANAIDWIAGNTELIELRTREVTNNLNGSKTTYKETPELDLSKIRVYCEYRKEFSDELSVNFGLSYQNLNYDYSPTDWTATDTDTDFEIDYVIPIIKISYDLYFDSQFYKAILNF